jgi:hypothetical protein
MDEQPPVFTRHSDPDTGREWVTVDRFPEEIFIAAELLETAHADVLRVQGDRVHLVVANGEAEYLLGPLDAATNSYRAARLYLRERYLAVERPGCD